MFKSILIKINTKYLSYIKAVYARISVLTLSILGVANSNPLSDSLRVLGDHKILFATPASLADKTSHILYSLS
jgi:hypothetical protein